jgi:hypothetical protein
MAVPYIFANVTTTIPLSQLDANFATAVTLGNTSMYLGNTTTSVGNLTLTNVTISSVASTFPNSYLANSSVTIGNTSVSLGSTQTTFGNVVLQNANITSVAATFPNSYLANSTVTLGNATLTLGGTTTSVGNLTLTNATISTGNVTVTDLNVSNSAVISANTAGDALRITQTGAGNALLVEDSTNPDSTPFVVNTNGIVIQGTTAFDSNWFSSGNVPKVFQIANPASTNREGFASISYSGAPGFSMFRATGGVIGTEGAVANGDITGLITFAGYDGTTAGAILTATIRSDVDGTPSVGDMPGRLLFFTTANGASSSTERMRIDSAGNVGVAATASAGVRLQVGGNGTGSASSRGVGAFPTIQSDVTTSYQSFRSSTATAAASFTLAELSHFAANQNTIGAGSTVTNQYGFNVASTLTGATNNFGFFSDIAAGTGRWNFYANGTANNAFAGSSSFGTTSAPTALVTIAAGTATANTAPLKFTSGVNLTTPEAGVIEYDGTIMSATTNTSFKRGTIPITNYASGTGTTLTTNGESTLQNLLPAANDTITLPIGTYFIDTSFIVTRGASTTSATARLNILGSGAAVGSFSGMSLSAPTAGGATANFSFDAVNINVSNVLTTASTTSGGVYTITLRGIMKITTAGTIVPQYNLSANINGAGTVAKVLYFRLQQLDTQSAAAFGPAGTGWG